MIYQPADLRPKTLKTAVSGFFLLISVAYLERYLTVSSVITLQYVLYAYGQKTFEKSEIL